MFPAHVLTFRRSKLYYTASGIITLIGGHPVYRLREDSQLLEWTVPYRFDENRGCIIHFLTPDDKHMELETCRGMK